MTRAIHASEDIWHRSIEDLLKAIEPARVAARGPFVINLRTTTAPIGTPPKDLPHFERLQVYQLVGRLQGRPQFQLRLGIIESELEADAILATLRERYPSATKEAADDTDRAAIASVIRSPRPPASAIAASNSKAPVAPVPSKKAAATPKTAIEPVEEFRWDIDELLPDLAKIGAPKREQMSPNRSGTRARGERKPPLPTPLSAETLQIPSRSVAPAAVAATMATGPLRSEAASTDAVPVPVPVQGPAPRAALERRPRHIPTLEPVRSERKARRLDPPAASEPQPLDVASSLDTLTQLAEPHPVAAPTASTGAVHASASAGSGENASADLGVLQSIVTKIGTLIETVEEHEEEANVWQHQASAPVVLAPPAAIPAPIASEPTQPLPSRQPTMPSSPRTASKPASSPVIDSTQTIRALTSLELADGEASQWFAIQLTLGEEPIDAEQVPNLDIFEEYPLYSVMGLDQDRLMHALRVGFFSSQVAAEAVSGYLATYFAAPAIKRVSIAERERFAEGRVAARKDVGASGTHAIIEFVAAPVLPQRCVDVALADTDKRSTPEEAPSLWSRLTALRTRK